MYICTRRGFAISDTKDNTDNGPQGIAALVFFSNFSPIMKLDLTPVIAWIQIQIIGLLNPDAWRADITIICQLLIALATAYKYFQEGRAAKKKPRRPPSKK